MADIPGDHDERLEQAMAYYGGDLSPEERAEFEAHLASCAECTEALRLAKVAFPAVEQVLGFTPKHSIDEQVARFEARVRERDEKSRAVSTAASTRPRRARLWVGLAVAAAVAAIALLVFLRMTPLGRPGEREYAPIPSGDGG
jgi:anti-sigma factor RsiW